MTEQFLAQFWRTIFSMMNNFGVGVMERYC